MIGFDNARQFQVAYRLWYTSNPEVARILPECLKRYELKLNNLCITLLAHILEFLLAELVTKRDPIDYDQVLDGLVHAIRVFNDYSKPVDGAFRFHYTAFKRTLVTKYIDMAHAFISKDMCHLYSEMGIDCDKVSSTIIHKTYGVLNVFTDTAERYSSVSKFRTMFYTYIPSDIKPLPAPSLSTVLQVVWISVCVGMLVTVIATPVS